MLLPFSVSSVDRSDILPPAVILPLFESPSSGLAEGRKETNISTTNSVHFIYSYTVLVHSDNERIMI